MKRLSSLMLVLSIMFPVFAQADGWTPYMKISANYFEGTHDNHRIVLIMENHFHNCGWNDGVNIHLSQVGPEAFKSYTAVVLAAWVSGKALAVNWSGCIGNDGQIGGKRANVKALRIAK